MTDDGYYDEGYTPSPTVFVKDSEKTSVLDKNGEPYSVRKKNPIGFILKGKPNK